jgi:uncharacterized protein with HEPN domain
MYIDDATRLRHMRDAASEAVAFAAGRERIDLDTDRMLVLALLKCIETVGEAAFKISRNFRDAHSGIPWRQLIGIRNSLVHDYYDIDVDAVWATIQDDLPPLIISLDNLIDDQNA